MPTFNKLLAINKARKRASNVSCEVCIPGVGVIVFTRTNRGEDNIENAIGFRLDRFDKSNIAFSIHELANSFMMTSSQPTTTYDPEASCLLTRLERDEVLAIVSIYLSRGIAVFMPRYIMHGYQATDFTVKKERREQYVLISAFSVIRPRSVVIVDD